MTDSAAPSTPSPSRARLWLAIGGGLAALSIALLWPLREVGQVCIAIYPPPPGCGSPVPSVAVFAGIALIVALVCAMVVVTLTAPARWPLVVVFAAFIVAVAVIAAGIVVLSQTGVWDAPPIDFAPLPVEPGPIEG